MKQGTAHLLLHQGAAPGFHDPVSYSFAHGGKDGYPYPVSRRDYDRSTAILEEAIRAAKIGRAEKLSCLKRLASLPLTDTKTSG